MKKVSMILVVALVAAIGGTVFGSAYGTHAGFPIAKLKLNGQEVTPPSPAIVVDGTTYVPLRFVANSMGAQIQWDQATETVGIDFVASSSPTTAQVVKQPVEGFRGVRWGSSQTDVKNVETGTRLSNNGDTPDVLGYKDKLGYFDVNYIYRFVDDKLVNATYHILNGHSNSNDYITDFKDLKSSLIAKYGTPKSDNINWKSDLFKSDPQHWGTAVTMGDLVYLTTWETPETEITLMLYGDNFEASVWILYDSKDLKGLAEKSNDGTAGL